MTHPLLIKHTAAAAGASKSLACGRRQRDAVEFQHVGFLRRRQRRVEFRESRVRPAETYFVRRVAELEAGAELRLTALDVVLLDYRVVGDELFQHHREEVGRDAVG